MTKKDVQLNIRMTKELKDRIEASAKENNRTTNAEAITLIEKALSSGYFLPLDFVPDDLVTENKITPEEKKELNELLSETVTSRMVDVMLETHNLLRERLDKIVK